ncbi:MAG TPA: M23 family metallopeptidase, partial [Saprospiraceae bacterium]|nr:M23 family metallopeptidase [Saprospiraceae bacterium]
MKERRLILLFFLIFIISYTANSQNQSIFLNTIGGQYYLGENNAKEPCISKQQYEEIEKDCANNIQKLGLPFKKQKGSMITTLSWPLKAAPGLNDCSFYVISAHVDQDFSAVNFKDYNCGTNTYDGHKGTDIATFPFGIYKIDHDEVQVIAAAAGTIINKTDGNFDKNCASNNLTANSIVIQHADGSTALYLHMKKNSLTSKGIGASIAVGEFLGIVGSSGNSTGPHLHFEVWSGSTSASYIDPFSGTCNLLNTSTWWVNQKPYTEPEVVKVSVNTTDIVIPGCPATETPNEANCFTIPFQGPGLPAGYAKFYIFFRNETQGMTANMSILNPDGSTFNSWTYNSISSYNASWRTWSKVLPTIGGTYTFKASYNGLSCEKKFDIVKAVITPGGSINICQGSSANLQASLAKTYLWSNGDTTQNINVSAAGDYKVTITNTYGCTSVSESVNVKVNQSPVAVITSDGPTIFCDGGTLKLSANSSSSYKWSTGETTQSINVTTSGAYKVTITNSSACTAASNPINVTINLNPIVNISPTGPISFCEGGIQKLSSSLANSYLWSNGDTTQNINVSASGNYKVTVTSSLGCSSISKAVIIKVNPNPIIKIGPTGPTSFCPGDFVELVCDLSTSYKWNTGATSEVIFADTAGAYSVTVTDQNGC